VHKILQEQDRTDRRRPAPRAIGATTPRNAAGGKWREQDSNLRRLSREIYSLVPLTARVSRPKGAESSVAGTGTSGSPGSIS